MSRINLIKLVAVLTTSLLVAPVTPHGSGSGSATDKKSSRKPPGRKSAHGPHSTELKNNVGVAYLIAKIILKRGNMRLFLTQTNLKPIDLSKVKAQLFWQNPNGGSKKPIALKKVGKGHSLLLGKFQMPDNVHRVYFHIECLVNSEKQKGRILYMHNN